MRHLICPAGARTLRGPAVGAWRTGGRFDCLGAFDEGDFKVYSGMVLFRRLFGAQVGSMADRYETAR